MEGVDEAPNENPPVAALGEKEEVPKEGVPKVNGLAFSSAFSGPDREERSALKRLLLVVREGVVVGNADCFLSSDALLSKNEGVVAFSSGGLENNGNGREATGTSDSLEGALNKEDLGSDILGSADFPPKMKLLLPEGKIGVKPLPGVGAGRVVEVIGLFSVEDAFLGPPKLKPALVCACIVVTGAAVDEEDVVVEVLLLSNFF
jgi:hypothetical protein